MYSFPLTRLRRNRKANWSRELFSEVRLHPSNFIQPIFVVDGKSIEEPISSFPQVSRLSIDKAVQFAKESSDAGIKMVMLFPKVDNSLKDVQGSYALDRENFIYKAINEIKEHVPEIGVGIDIALDPYTSHGHDGVLDETGYVINDESLKILTEMAVIAASSGVDVVCPSDMMDGRILTIRETLENEGFLNTQIMSYAAKYISSFYGPFRDAVDSKNFLKKSDKKSYQMIHSNVKEAMIEVEMDITEGSDSIIIKPGLPYIDVVARIAEFCMLPIVSFQISGEYSCIKVAAQNGIINEKEAFLETMFAFRRAGARAVISYAAKDIARWCIE